MNHLHEISTGRLVSSTSAPINPIPEGMSVVSLPNGDEDGIWNQSTLLFDPRPADMRESGEVFWGRFTEAEQENLVEAAATIPKAAALLKAMSFSTINRADIRIINRVNAMELNGRLDSAGRAAEILNG